MPQNTPSLVAQALHYSGLLDSDPRQPAVITKNSRTVLDRRYLKKDKDGIPTEQPNDMFYRVADNLAAAEYNYTDDPAVFEAARQQFYDLLTAELFLTNSPTLMNAGRELQQLSACFVLPVPDSIEDIFTCVRSTAIIHKSGGGTGFDFSRLRPAGDRVKSTEGIASGPVSFIDAFDTATAVVKQGGTRRGANMGILRVDHPDIMEFIHRKSDPTKLQNFNISVAATDEFMRAVQHDRSYDLIHPNSKQAVGSLRARQVFEDVTNAAWATGDPGMIFIDAMNRDNPNQHVNTIESTNPCITADALITTDQGTRTVAELIGVQFTAMVDGVPFPSHPDGFFRNGHKDVIRIVTDNGRSITLTPDHLVSQVSQGAPSWTPAGDIVPGNRLRVHQHLPEARPPLRGAPTTFAIRVATTTVLHIEPAGTADVYDASIPGINVFDANGYYVHNCGEQMLAPYESCNLGSLNLARMVFYDDQQQQYSFDYDLMREVTQTAVHMLDNVIDVNNWPLEEIKEASLASRRIGVGIMGFADLLIIMGIPYGSQEALDTAHRIMSSIRTAVWAASQQLAETRGHYPSFPGSLYELEGTPPMRNTAPVTIAPTGTISIIAGTSSGIEPLFALAYVRNVMDNTQMVEYNYLFDEVARYYEFNTPAAMEHIQQTGAADHPDVPKWAQELFQVSHQVPPMHHVDMQASFQQHTDNAVSKTINLPNEATVAQVAAAYLHAWQNGCKGITIYRDGSKELQVLSTQDTRYNVDAPIVLDKEPRSRIMKGSTIRLNTGHGATYVTINGRENAPSNPFEVFANMGKAGSCDSAHIEAICRLASTSLRAGVDPDEIINQLQGITCHPNWDNGIQIKSTPDAIAHALMMFIANDLTRGNKHQPAVNASPQPDTGPTQLQLYAALNPCPECQAETIMAEGCRHCPQCGWNRCE